MGESSVESQIAALWTRTAQQQYQITRLAQRQAELCDENAILHACLQREGVLAGQKFSVLLHRQRFTRALQRYPCDWTASLLDVMKTRELSFLVSEFVGFVPFTRIAKTARLLYVAMDEVADELIACCSTRMYVLGGLDGKNSLNTVEILDTQTGAFDSGPSMRTMRANHAVAAVRGKIYAVGGEQGRQVLSSVERYEPGQTAWESVSPVHIPRTRCSAAVLDGKLFIVGGYDGKENLNVVECFHASTEMWELFAPMKIPRSRGSAVALGGKIYALGGFGHGEILDNVECLHIDTQRWEDLPSMLTPRSNFCAAVIEGRIYVMGGLTTGGVTLSSMECFDPELKTWQILADMPSPRQHASSAAHDGTIYLFGGHNGAQSVETVNLYDSKTCTWHSAPSLRTPNRAAAAAACRVLTSPQSGATILPQK